MMTNTMVHGSVNQSFIVYKKGGVISEGECPSQLHTQNKNANNRRTLPHFTNICEFNLPILPRTKVL